MAGLVDHLLSAPAWAVYLVVTGLVFAEDALFVGFVIPGESAAVLGGVVANRGQVSLPAVLVLVVAAAIAGDSVGYEVGRHVGSRLLESKRLTAQRERLQRAQDLLARRGGLAVFLGRFVAFFRAVMPALAGTAGMRYPTFLGFNAAGGLCWGTAAVLLGYLAGDSYQRLESLLGRDVAAVALALLAVAAIVAVVVRRRRRTREPRGPSH